MVAVYVFDCRGTPRLVAGGAGTHPRGRAARARPVRRRGARLRLGPAPGRTDCGRATRRRRADRVGPPRSRRPVVASDPDGHRPETLLDPVHRARYLEAMDVVQAGTAHSSRSRGGSPWLPACRAVRRARGRGLPSQHPRAHRARHRPRPGRGPRWRRAPWAAARSVPSTSPRPRRNPPPRLDGGARGDRASRPVAPDRLEPGAVASSRRRGAVRNRRRGPGPSTRPRRADRQVRARRIENGLGELVLVDEWPVASAIHDGSPHERRTCSERRGGGHRSATMGPRPATSPRTAACRRTSNGEWLDTSGGNQHPAGAVLRGAGTSSKHHPRTPPRRPRSAPAAPRGGP